MTTIEQRRVPVRIRMLRDWYEVPKGSIQIVMRQVADALIKAGFAKEESNDEIQN